MGSLGDNTDDFRVLDDLQTDDVSLPAFMVSSTRGFLPRIDPIVSLPADFDPLEFILQRMPIKTLSGEPGLLADGKLGETVTNELPELTDCIDKYKDNLPLMNALYRDYSFLASAYLLEPCHQRFMLGEPYGLGRETLPANISRPIARCAALCDFKPFMEYAGSYALYNYRLADPSLGLAPSNVRLIRAFEHGLDPDSSEAGFVLVHIDMVRHSAPLVQGALGALAARTTGSRSALHSALKTVLTALTAVNVAMDTMWRRSRPREYTSFRTFIFGITAQSMFPRGVLYAGVAGPDDDDDGGADGGGTRMSFRGESGANDSMIPLVDNLLGVPMPDTPLTQILHDFREYRPSNHRAFLGWVRGRSEALGLKAWALGLDGKEEADERAHEESRRLWLRILNQVRDFRWRHWCFAREYILKQTNHPTATGGSPIVTWLPNQLQAVLDEMVLVYSAFGGEKGRFGQECSDIMCVVRRQQEMLRKEVRKYCEERGAEATTVSSN
ncbi:indoleamine 2,3-dioxygenase-like protein [Lasiosphaeris hirsuta]|uniref:Indoleamine 2,3-dioxygenase-like protein n=1 Tax=Lasiosphaeris hirsuta TaxID=260670 RepID=A0AA40ARB3_9PEZI|nr:indoleamine 2,3-dioxygenase-like protein [Lasiosphaeris hirsuta]